MKVHIRHINKNGYDIPLNNKEPWLIAIFENLFPEKNVDLESIVGNIHLSNYDGNIHLAGLIEFTRNPLCDRCGTELTRRESIRLQANFVPFQDVSGEALQKDDDEEEERELTSVDLDFAFYEKDEVEIDPIVNDEIALAIPYNIYCADKVKCDAHHSKVLFGKLDTFDPRWSALKGFKGQN